MNDQEKNMFTYFDLYVADKKVGFADLSFKPEKDDIIEFDETVGGGGRFPENYFIFRVDKIRYSHTGFTGRLYGEIIE